MAVVATLFAAAAVVAAVTPAFSPPLGRDILYRTEQIRHGAGGAQRYAMTNRLSFARDPAGWRLTLTLVDLSSEAPADAAAIFDAAMRPFLGTPIVLRLDPDGRPAAVMNADAAWPAIVASVARAERAFAARAGARTAAIEATAAWLRGFAALDGASRDERLLQTADPLIGFDLPPLRPGASAPWRTGAGATSGTIALESASPDALAYRLITALPLPGGAAPLDEDVRFRIDPASGMLIERRAVRRVGPKTLSEEVVTRLD